MAPSVPSAKTLPGPPRLPAEQPEPIPVPALERPRLALRVGLAGNRDLSRFTPAQFEKIQAAAGEIFREISAGVLRNCSSTHYSEAKPLVRFVTGLASGFDQVLTGIAFAEAAEPKEGAVIERELLVIYPYDPKKYHQVNPVLTPPPREIDWALVLDAGSTAAPFPEVPDAPENALAQRSLQRAYQAQGWWLRQQSDLLVAVWDPARPFKAGGTEDTVQHALRQGLPVVWILPGEESEVRVLRDLDQLDLRSAPLVQPGDVTELIGQLLAFPESSSSSVPLEHPGLAAAEAEFFQPPPSEPSLRQRLWANGLLALEFMAGLERRLKKSWGNADSDHTHGFSVREDPPQPKSQAEPYRRYAAQAEAWASFYSGQYRGGFLLNHALAWLAVLFASLGLLVLVLSGHEEKPSSLGMLLGLAELVVILATLRNVWLSRHEQWHEKSIDFRYLAELLRQMDFLAPLGCATPSSRPPVQYAGNDPRQSWMSWLFRALVRAAPPVLTHDGQWPRKTFTEAYAQSAVASVRREWIWAQRLHHRNNWVRLGAIHSTIEFWSKFFFYFVLGSVAVHFGLDLGALVFHVEVSHGLVASCIVLAVVLPAAAITLIGFRNQAEVRRLSERSRNMARQLGRFSSALRRIERPPSGIVVSLSHSWEAAARISAVGQTIIDEVTDWQIVYRMHEISEA